MVDLVARTITHTSDRFAEPDASATDVEAAWHHILALHQRQGALGHALKVAEEAWYRDCTEEAQTRLLEIKRQIATAQPYRSWLNENLVHLAKLPESEKIAEPDHATVLKRQQAFGYTFEDQRMLLLPMAKDGSAPQCCSATVSIDVVVVLPCVPATAMPR